MATLNVKGFPDDLYEELKKRADREHRSLAQEVIHLLARELQTETRSLLDLRGLGREVWGSTEAERFVAEERATWGD